MVDATEIIDQSISRREIPREDLRAASEVFHEREGELFERSEAREMVEEELDVDSDYSQTLLAEIVGDNVDPIIQMNAAGVKYVGIIDYFEGDVYYAYTDHNDIQGELKTVVAAQSVADAETDEDIIFAREGVGSFAGDYECGYEPLIESIQEYHEENYDVDPEDVETGATLLSGTTIGGNVSWHAGNDGAGSGLDADTLDGQHASDITTKTGPAFSSEGGDPIFDPGNVETRREYSSFRQWYDDSGTRNLESITFDVSDCQYIIFRARYEEHFDEHGCHMWLEKQGTTSPEYLSYDDSVARNSVGTTSWTSNYMNVVDQSTVTVDLYADVTGCSGGCDWEIEVHWVEIDRCKYWSETA